MRKTGKALGPREDLKARGRAPDWARDRIGAVPPAAPPAPEEDRKAGFSDNKREPILCQCPRTPGATVLPGPLGATSPGGDFRLDTTVKRRIMATVMEKIPAGRNEGSSTWLTRTR